jgi:hypothetical protein
MQERKQIIAALRVMDLEKDSMVQRLDQLQAEEVFGTTKKRVKKNDDNVDATNHTILDFFKKEASVGESGLEVAVNSQQKSL